MTKLVYVTGMHRSGTSLIVRMLNLAGAYLGAPESLMGVSEYNERGHWEYIPVVQRNDWILEALGGYVWNTVPAHLTEEDKSTIRSYAPQAQRVIDDLLFGAINSRKWGVAVKDPRFCITLPAWEHLVPKSRIIICLRNPLQVAYSIYARDRMELLDGIRLWKIYNDHALQHAPRTDRLVVNYEDMLQYPEFESWRIARYLGMPLTDIANVVTEPQKKLKHYHFTFDELKEMVCTYLEGPEADTILFLYEQMLAEAHEPY